MTQTVETPVGVERNRRRGWQSLIGSPALDSERPGPWSSAAQRRDSLYRRLIATADIAAVAIAVLIGLVLVGGATLRPAIVLVPIAYVIAAKVSGLYERDEHLLHKTTLEEVPALFAISAVAAMLLWVVSGGVVEGDLGQAGVIAFWLSLFGSLLAARRRPGRGSPADGPGALPAGRR